MHQPLQCMNTERGKTFFDKMIKLKKLHIFMRACGSETVKKKKEKKNLHREIITSAAHTDTTFTLASAACAAVVEEPWDPQIKEEP